jgi:DNA-binding GntR family transcriptional regulator
MFVETRKVVFPQGSAAAERCIKFLLGQIRSGQLRPSERIGENGIARLLGLGRGPVRTAFQHLTSLGFLQRMHRAGTFVRQPSLEKYCQIMDIRAVLEGLAGRLACRRATDDDLNQLLKLAVTRDELNEQVMYSTPAKMRRMFEIDLEFHGGIARLSGNEEIERILTGQHIIERSYHLGVRLPLGRKTLSQRGILHRQIAQALRARNEDEVERLLRQHVEVAKEAQLAEIHGDLLGVENFEPGNRKRKRRSYV